ncbi:MAG: tetratricopeptide repeat protein [Enhygromyxa sp.]
MKIKLALVLGGLGLLGIGTDDDPGWLARALASTDSDVDAAIASYEAGDHAAAIEQLDAAVARRGERAELYYDRGLILVATGELDDARALFQNGTLSEHPQVQASSHYQLGSLALALEDWDGAIEAFRECLRIQPEHHNAKWNLELALLRKLEQEKQEQEDQDQQDQDQQDQDQQDQDQQDQDQQDQDQQDQDQQDQDQQDQDQQDQDQQDQDQQGQDQQDQDQQDQQQQDQQEQDQQDQQQQDQQQDQQQQDQQQQDQQQQDQQQVQPIEGGDLDSALEELDRQDAFMFGRPRGARRKVEKDW